MAVEIGYYACEHQSSNEPCDICQPGQPVMPEDWRDNYGAPDPEVETYIPVNEPEE